MTDTPHPRETRAALPMALLRAREAVMARFRPMLAAQGINEQQWRVVRVLAEGGALDATELAARANVLAPSLTRMIRAMTDRGLITRGRDAGDGRRVVLTLTARGQALLHEVTPQSEAIYRGIEAEVGLDRVAALLSQLNALTERLEGSAAPRDLRPPSEDI
jgi:homoprotocatechuate degradation regulator HpaR